MDIISSSIKKSLSFKLHSVNIGTFITLSEIIEDANKNFIRCDNSDVEIYFCDKSSQQIDTSLNVNMWGVM